MRAAEEHAHRLEAELDDNGLDSGWNVCPDDELELAWWEHWYADEDPEDFLNQLGWSEATFWTDISRELGLS